MKIAIIGKGNVGSALADGLRAAKHEIRFGSTDVREPVADTVAWGDVVILAVPWTAHKEIAEKYGKVFAGKTVIDVSNVMTPNLDLAMGFTTSGAEELQKRMPGARIIKTLNTIFAQNMRTGTLRGEKLTAFVAGDDTHAKDVVCTLVKDIGFDCVDAGPLKSARLLEPMGLLNITLGYGLKMGTDIGLTLVHKRGKIERKAA